MHSALRTLFDVSLNKIQRRNSLDANGVEWKQYESDIKQVRKFDC